MRIDVLTIFPEMFEGPLTTSVVGNARERGLLDVHMHDIRDWTTDKHRTTDDCSYGGGPGMLMKPEPLFESVTAVQALEEDRAHVVFLTPRGRRFDQSAATRFAAMERVLLVCGRYEGFDERTLGLADEQLSIGDYILTGGELAAMVVVDATARLVPGVLGHEESASDESFVDGLLEYPQYTRPAEYAGMLVPDVLLSGDHARIAAWRREQSIRRTARMRPDLLEGANLTDDERRIAAEELERSTGDA